MHMAGREAEAQVETWSEEEGQGARSSRGYHLRCPRSRAVRRGAPWAVSLQVER